MAGVEVYTAPSMKAHFRLAFDSHSDVHLLEMLTAREPFSRFASFYNVVNTKQGRWNACTCVWFSRKLYRLCKFQQLIKFLTFRSVHFHPSRCARPSFPIFEGLAPRLGGGGGGGGGGLGTRLRLKLFTI